MNHHMCFTLAKKSEKIETSHTGHHSVIGVYDAYFFTRIDDCATLLTFPYSDIFLSANYWQALEKAPPKDMRFCYIVLRQNEQTVGFIPFQIHHFNAARSINFQENSPNRFLKIRQKVAEKVDFNTLVLGNLSLTGEHLYWFNNELFTNDDKHNIIFSCIYFAKKLLTEYNIIIKTVLLKEYFSHQVCLENEGYNRFSVEPNFIFDIDPTWTSFEHYLSAISSKYRVRAKKAFKRLGSIEKKEFNEERIIAYKDSINVLYQTVCNRSSFNLVDLQDDYFVEMKRQLGERFRLFGYFLDKELVGFYSTIDNGVELDAHFIGYNLALNDTYQIYLNFLFDFIKIGIETGSKHINFSRTAHEIKSSVGAKPHDMYLYIKHENGFINKLLPFIPEFLSPKEEWQPRNPFKETSEPS